MDVYLDNTPIALPASPLGDMLDGAREQMPDGERMIVEVRVDGRTLDSEELDQQAEITPQAEELQFITARPADLAREALNEVADALNRALEAQQQAAEFLQQDRTGEAMDPIRESVRIWSQTQQAVLHAAQLLGIDLDHLLLEGDTPRDLIAATSQALHTLRDQLQQQDWLGLADTLGYDLAELIPRWHHLLATLTDRADPAAAGDVIR